MPKDKITASNFMVFRGLRKTTLLDFPGKVSCIVFVAGCNFRCPFCQNKELVLSSGKLPIVSEEDFFKFLKTRIGLLDGVVISGGEPTLCQDLNKTIKRIKSLGFLVKLDTNGTNPEVLVSLYKEDILDYLAMDFKGPLEKYSEYVGIKDDGLAAKITKSLQTILNSRVDFEFRTTVVPGLHSENDLLKMASELAKQPVIFSKEPIKWFLQQFRPDTCLDPDFEKIKPYPKEFFAKILPKLREDLPQTLLRGI